MPNKSSWASKSTSSVLTPNNERSFALRLSLAKWGRSRSTHQVAVVVEESLASTTTTSSSSSSSSSAAASTASLSSNSIVTTEEESGRPASDQNHQDASLPVVAGGAATDNEIVQVPSRESTRTNMEEESGVESDSCPEDLAGSRKRTSSLDQLESSTPTLVGGPHDHVHKQARATLQDSSKTRDRFMSILDRPFHYWHELNMVLKEVYPEWSPYQRGRMIHHLIHFLELKIGRDEYVPTGLLFPTPVVEAAWRALVMETSLYLKVIYTLQDFHSKDREMIHYTLILKRELSPSEIEDKIRRTQSLFLVYFKEIMPVGIDDEPHHPPALLPAYDRPRPSRDTPTFGTTPTCNTGIQHDTTIMELSSLSLKDICGISPQEDDTASTQHSAFSGYESEGLMGLELVD